jgi:tRNA pseudouridine38-40 synthase
MYFIDVYRRDQQVIIDICANAFLHHMVRNIAGVLMEIGMGRQAIDWTDELLELRDRSRAAVTASPHGLHLGGVLYPEHYEIDRHPLFDKLPKDARRFD